MAETDVLLTYDGSRASREAFPHALRLARITGGDVLLLRVHAVPPGVWAHPEEDVRARELDGLRSNWEADLARVAREIETKDGPRVRPVMRMLGERWTFSDEILAVADEFEPALICMATQGESAVRHFVFGSTALDVVSRSSRPVALIRATGGD